MRVSLGVEGGGELMLSLEDGALVAMTRAEALRRLRDRLRQAVPPEHSLAAELIADRRQDAARRG